MVNARRAERVSFLNENNIRQVKIENRLSGWKLVINKN